MSGSIGFFLGSFVLDGYILSSPPIAAFSAACNSFSCPTVGGLNLPNTIVNVSSLAPPPPSGSPSFALGAA